MGSRAKQLMTDVVALAMNVIGSVGFILVNKQLMSVYGYDFGYATTLAAIHLAITALMRIVPNTTRPLALKSIPRWEILWLSLVSNMSTACLYLSLMFNSVEFYQISKLSTIPIVCVMEWIVHNRHYSREAKISVLVVMTGVGACTVAEMKDNTKGFLCACLAALSTSFQQIYMSSLQKKYSVGIFELMSKTAPIQAATLLLLGPFIDYYVNGIFLTDNEMSVGAVMFVFLSYTLAVFCNITQYFQYLFIKRLHSVTFHFLDRLETVCVLVLGWVLFDPSPTLKSILAVTVAVVGSVLYSWAVEVENQRLWMTKYFRSMDKILAEKETTMLKEEAGTKPVKDIEHGETDTLGRILATLIYGPYSYTSTRSWTHPCRKMNDTDEHPSARGKTRRKLCRILFRRGKGGKGGRVRASLSVKPVIVASQVSLRSVFSYFDVNGDGKITPEELRTTVGEERMTAEEAAAAVKSLDLDGDGVLGLDEFEQLMEEARGEDERERELKEAFQIFKAEEESEGITASGLKRMLTRLGEVWSMEECRMMIKEFDLDGNGVISFDEFVSMMT